MAVKPAAAVRHPALWLAGALASVAWPSRALADETAAARRAAAAREMDRGYMMAELGAGFLTLPTTICLTSLTDCDKGEASVSLALHNIYRYRAFGFGAGIQWATTLRGDDIEDTSNYPELEREHSRRYFMVEGQFRWYGIRTSAWEFYAGITVGGVVVNDSWTTKADRQPAADTAFVGPRAATIGTEGLLAGLGLGAEWTFASNWSFGTRLGYASWFLPSRRERSPTGDLASLSGRVDSFDVGLALAYRIAL